jgi:hypothetical protein
MMTKNEILKEITRVVSTEDDIAKVIVKLYDLNFAYNRLLMIEGTYTRKKEINICE